VCAGSVGTDFTSYWVYVAGPRVGVVVAVGAAWVLRGPGGGRAGSAAAQGDLFTEVEHRKGPAWRHLGRATNNTPARRRGRQRRGVAVGDGGHTFDHVVSLMFENRSFDNLLGHLYEPGIADRRGGTHDHGTDQLEGWSRQRAIVDFVTAATQDGPRFIPAADRIATFDNDGTLWVEQPMPPQFDFVFRKWAAEAKADPSLAAQQPYKAIIEKDEAFFAM
jgi:hypothetical protein